MFMHQSLLAYFPCLAALLLQDRVKELLIGERNQQIAHNNDNVNCCYKDYFGNSQHSFFFKISVRINENNLLVNNAQ